MVLLSLRRFRQKRNFFLRKVLREPRSAVSSEEPALQIRRSRTTTPQVSNARVRSALVELESNLDTNLHIHWMTIFLCGLETPLFDRFNRFRIESESQPAHHTNVAGISVIINDQPQDAGSLRFGIASFFGVFGVRGRDCLRSRDSSANLIYSTTHAAAAARAHSRPVTDAHAATGPGTNTSARTGSIRRRSRRKRRAGWIAQAQHMVLCHPNLRWNHHRRLNCKLGMFIAHDDLRRSDLLQRKLRQSAFRRLYRS